MLTTLQQAKKLKELGCNIATHGCYDFKNRYRSHASIFDWNHKSSDSISAPTIHEALDWFREVKGIVCYVDVVFNPVKQKAFYIGKVLSPSGLIIWIKTSEFDTHSEAESALLDEVMKYVEGKWCR